MTFDLQVKAKRRQMQTTKSDSADERQLISLTVTLVTISVAFMIFTLPSSLLYLFDAGYVASYRLVVMASYTT